MWSLIKGAMGSPDEEQPPDLDFGDGSSSAAASSSSSSAASSSTPAPGFPAVLSLESQLNFCQDECRSLAQQIAGISEALRRAEMIPSWQEEIKQCMKYKADLETVQKRLVKDSTDCEAQLNRLLDIAEAMKKERAISSLKKLK